MLPAPRTRLVLALIAPIILATQLIAQSPPNTAQQQLDNANFHAILQHLVLITSALTPKTGKPLETNLQWALATVPPSDCPTPHPAGNQPCLRLTYNAADAGVSCEWVVMLPPDGSLAILSENDDAARYFMQTLSPAEAKPLVLTRSVPAYPANAKAANVQGDVKLVIVVNANGKPLSATTASGASMMNSVSLDAIGGWTFKPLQAGTRAIPFQTEVTFHFSIAGPSSATVTAIP
jgi:TonB family protein